MLVIVVGCGGGAGTGPLTADEAEGVCTRICERDIECGDTSQTLEMCTASCVADVSGGWLRADAFEAIGECSVALACGADDDVCLRECAPTATHEEYEAQCRSALAACVANPSELDLICETTPMPGVDGDDLGYYCLVTPSVLEEMIGCIPDGVACAAGASCLQAVLERHGLGAN